MANIHAPRIVAELRVGPTVCRDGLGAVVVEAVGANAYRVSIRGGTMPTGHDQHVFDRFAAAFSLASWLARDQADELAGNGVL
jgi:hypothetical protein